jgi:cellulose synthase/poly-beta-1,6-N-acetylglucosamine synthase-like glycosyltransferase
VVIAAYNEERTIKSCLRSLLNLDYPQYEIFIVNDGSDDDTLKVLTEEAKLERCDINSHQHFETAEVKTVYRSTLYKELYVIDKDNGGNKADAVNAGINFAHYPYICMADADTLFIPQSLTKAMQMVLRDPQRVVSVGSLLGISNGLRVENGTITRFDLPKEAIGVLQMIEYIRTFLVVRLAWTRLNCMLVVSGGFGIYQRDLLVQLGGFSSAFTCEDIEMTFRIHEHMRRNKIPYRIINLPEPLAWTEVPHTLKDLYSQRHRWQRVIDETCWKYRHMFLNPKYGTVGLVGVPYFVLGEALAWIPELVAVLSIPLAILLGAFVWKPLILILGVYIATNMLVSILGMLLQDAGYRIFSLRDIVRMILLSFIESFGYRQFLSCARLAGTVGFLRKDKEWNTLTRVEREDLH